MNFQLSLFPDEGNDSEQKSVSLANDSERQMQSHQYFHKNTLPVLNIYSPGKRKGTYYRLSYREGSRMKHIHIPGGNTSSDLVQYRVKKLQGLIDRGTSLNKIISAINSYRGNSRI